MSLLPGPSSAQALSRLIAIVEDLRAVSRETEWVEFKDSLMEPKAIGERISALSNAARLHDREFGYILWGVEDGSHKIIGTSFDPDMSFGRQPFKHVVMQKLAPCPHLSFNVVSHPEGRLVLLEVPAASDLPVSYDRIARIRIGSATPPLRDFPEIEKKLLAKLRPFVWEQGTASEFHTDEEIVDLLDHDAYLRLRGIARPTTTRGILERLAEGKMIAPDAGERWNILNLGAILLARRLDRFPTLERKALRIIQYAGQNRLHAKPEQAIMQGYAAGFQETLRYLNGILPAREVIGAVRLEERAYPAEAIKELLANTLIHQDMTVVGAGPKVEIFDDRIEFNNPGEPVTDWRKLFGAEPRSRNERMALTMRRMDLCEERGSGLRRIIGATNAAQLLPPEFLANDGSAKVILHGHRQNFDAMDQRTKIRATYYFSMILWEQNSRITNAVLRDRFPMQGSATVKASSILRACVDSGWLRVADPERPNSGYVPFWA